MPSNQLFRMVAACLLAGMQAHIAKPVSSDDIDRIARLYLGRSDATRPNPGSDPVGALPPALQERYLARKTALLAALHSQADAPTADQGEIADLIEKLHKIGGSADHFGDGDFGKAALELERALLASRPQEMAGILEEGSVRLQTLA